MIPTDVYVEILRKSLESQKSLYDYLQLILPIASGFVIAAFGWLFAVYQTKFTFRSQLKKEQYYKSKEAIVRISSLINDYMIYVYQFTKLMKNQFNERIPLRNDPLLDFITEEQMKRAYIHQLVRIDFPSNGTNSALISESVRKITDTYTDLAVINNRIIAREITDSDQINLDIVQLHLECKNAVEKITDLFSEVEVRIVNGLRDEAYSLQIVRTKRNQEKLKENPKR